MRILRFSTVILAILIAIPAVAQEAGRFTMRPTDEGMLRLDTQTGEVSLCSKATGNWACRSVPDERAALENEIDRLNAENRQLRAQLGKPGDTDKTKEAPTLRLPTDREVAELKSFLQKMMREFKALLEPREEEAPEKRL